MHGENFEGALYVVAALAQGDNVAQPAIQKSHTLADAKSSSRRVDTIRAIIDPVGSHCVAREFLQGYRLIRLPYLFSQPVRVDPSPGQRLIDVLELPLWRAE